VSLHDDNMQAAADPMLSYFGEDVTYTPIVGDPVVIQAIPTDSILDPRDGGRRTVGAKVTIAVFKTDVASPTRNEDTITVPGDWLDKDEDQTLRIASITERHGGIWILELA